VVGGTIAFARRGCGNNRDRSRTARKAPRGARSARDCCKNEIRGVGTTDSVLDRFEKPDAPRLLTFGTGHYRRAPIWRA
jgi:hypothetical protein